MQLQYLRKHVAPGIFERLQPDIYTLLADWSLNECYEIYFPSIQVPISIKGKDVMVALKDRKFLEIQVSLGARDSRRVEGLLRKPVRSFGNGSTWELISEGSCKACTATVHSASSTVA